jgi:hypothetical protein
MNKYFGRPAAGLLARCAIAILASSFAASAIADDDAAVKKDLFTVLALQGLPCGEVTSVTTRAENDHLASCKDGNRYHIFINAQGRVIVEKA